MGQNVSSMEYLADVTNLLVKRYWLSIVMGLVRDICRLDRVIITVLMILRDLQANMGGIYSCHVHGHASYFYMAIMVVGVWDLF
jgi:hypothetical protein